MAESMIGTAISSYTFLVVSLLWKTRSKKKKTDTQKLNQTNHTEPHTEKIQVRLLSYSMCFWESAGHSGWIQGYRIRLCKSGSTIYKLRDFGQGGWCLCASITQSVKWIWILFLIELLWTYSQYLGNMNYYYWEILRFITYLARRPSSN